MVWFWFARRAGVQNEDLAPEKRISTSPRSHIVISSSCSDWRARAVAVELVPVSSSRCCENHWVENIWTVTFCQVSSIFRGLGNSETFESGIQLSTWTFILWKWTTTFLKYSVDSKEATQYVDIGLLFNTTSQICIFIFLFYSVNVELSELFSGDPINMLSIHFLDSI